MKNLNPSVKELSNCINPAYLGGEILLKIQQTLENEGSVLLFHFLQKESFTKLKNSLQNVKFIQEKELLSHSYSKAILPKEGATFFQGQEFRAFLSFILNKRVNNFKPAIFALAWKDYLLLHDQHQEKPGVDIIFDFTATWNTEWGGIITYKEGEDYQKIPVEQNLLTLVDNRQKNHNKDKSSKLGKKQLFFQYVNHEATEQKRIFLMGKVR